MDKLFLLLFFVCLFLSSRPTLGQNYENIAIGKTYSISNKYTNDGQFNLSNAANNNTGGTFIATGPNSNCIHTAVGTGQDWWEVDLGYNYPIYSIKVWERTGNNNRLYPFQITVDQVVCATVPNGGSPQDVTCSSVLLGRRVRITLTQVRDCCLILCELQIYVCSAGWYGAQCEMQCPMACPGNTCDRLEGQCSFDNIATGKTYAISNKYLTAGDFNPSNAANGNTSRVYYASTGSSGNCINTLPYTPPHWWEVNLGNNFPIYNLKVWGRENGINRLYPFDITVDGTQCASLTKNNNLLEQAFACTSVITGRVVRITSRPTDCCLNLCELQIYVLVCGNNGIYGPNCNQTCSPTGCERCEKFTGQCYACKGSYNLVSPNCTDCLPGYYRENGNDAPCTNCTWQCYNNEPCNQNNGSCARCPPGLQGVRCQEACDHQKYGQDCAMNCSVHCKYNSGQTTCNAVNGSCPNCQAGYKPTLCDQECVDGWYGENCARQCGPCGGNTVCNKVTGACTCPIGKQPPLCVSDCQNKTYGQDCSDECGQCKDGEACNPVTGDCPAGCDPGYLDKRCQTECQMGFYGHECNETCGQCVGSSACQHDTGLCQGGCDDSYTGQFCKQAISITGGASTPLAAVIVPVVLVVVVVVIAIILIMWWRRRRSSRSGSHGDEGVVNYVATSEESKRNDHPAPAVNIPSTHNQADNNDHLQPSYANDDPDRRPYSLHGKPASVYSDPDETSVYTEPNEAPQYTEAKEEDTEAKEEGNNYESLHPYSNDDGDRQPYTRWASLNIRK